MKKINFNAVEVWKQVEDVLVPRLEMSVTDRAVYSHLLRHSRLEGKSRLRFSITWLARGVRLTGGPVRNAVRRLAAHGVLRLVERSKTGHVGGGLLPGGIRGGLGRGAAGGAGRRRRRVAQRVGGAGGGRSRGADRRRRTLRDWTSRGTGG